MDAAPATLSYGRPPRRNRRRVVLPVAAVFALATVAAGWVYRGQVRQYAGGQYSAWRFTRAFDRAAADLTPDGAPWLAPAAGGARDGRAARHLRTLLTLSNGGAAGRHNPDGNVVWFARSGETGGRRWIAFACVNGVGFELLAFGRELRGVDGYNLVLDTPSSPMPRTRPAALSSVAPEGDTVRVRFDVEGSPNEILWTLDPAGAGPGVGPGASSFAVPSTVTPLTGWVSPTHWWPATRGWRLIEGRRRARDLATDGGGTALAFLPDGRLASAGPFRVSLIDVESDGRERHGLPLDLSPSESFSFSPDGTRLFVGGHSQAAGLIDVPTGRARRYSHSTSGRAMAAFPDNDTLVMIDDVRRARSDWEGLKFERLDIGKLDAAYGFGAAGRRIAVPEGGDAVVKDLAEKAEVARFKSILLSQFHQFSLSPGGRWLAMKGRWGLRLADVDGGTVLWDHQGDGDFNTPFARVKWSADGLRGAAAGRQWAYVWSMAEPRWVARLSHGMTGESFDVALSPDGRKLAASARGFKTIAYWPDIDAAVGLSPGAPAASSANASNEVAADPPGGRQ